MIDPHKTKYHPMYWLMVEAAAAQSVATRHQVGAIVVTPTGMISVGWNGMPAGMDNNCESTQVQDFDEATRQYVLRGKTNPEVIHAERNAIDKMTRQGVPTQGSVLFISRSPCLECAKALQGLGLKAVYFDVHHDDLRGVDLLNQCGTPTKHRNHSDRYSIKPSTVDSRLVDPRGPGFTARRQRTKPLTEARYIHPDNM